MKPLKLMLFITLCSAAIISCTPTSKSRSFDYDYLFITKQGIIQRPLIADLEVGKQKLSLTKTYKNVTTEIARQNIIEEFINSNKADLIVQPYFSLVSEAKSGKTNVTISLNGYPANYINIRNYKPEDKELLLPRDYFLSPSSLPSRASATGQVPSKNKLAAVLNAAGM